MRSRGIDTVILAGCTTSGCIRASAIDSLQYGYHTIVVREAVGDRAPGPHEANLFDIDAKYGDVVQLAEALDYLALIYRERRFRGPGAARFRPLVAPRATRLSIVHNDWRTHGRDAHRPARNYRRSSTTCWRRAKKPRRSLSRRVVARGRAVRAGQTVCRSHIQATARHAAGSLPSKVDPDSAAARWLNEHFGGNWRYEISAQKREGDEAIVLGKLTFGRENAIRTQFGRAKISGDAVAASSGGLRFKVGGAGSEQDEREAFRRAAEAALSNCVDLI